MADQVTLNPLWAPLGVVLGGTALAYVAASVIVRDMTRAALLTSLAAVLVLGYGHARNALHDLLPGDWVLLAAWGAIAVIGAVLIFVGHKWLRPAWPTTVTPCS
jgi:hypothetical protein